VKVTLWGTRGSVAAPGPDTSLFGGNTSCVEIRGNDGTILVLDAGTGLRRLGTNLPSGVKRVDVLLTHLHMDHIQGLGFFAPLYIPGFEVHLWGPESATMSLRTRLARYLSPPLFPVHLRDLPCNLHLHGPPRRERIREFTVESWMICHPGPTVGYRISSREGIVAYMPDHEPALASDFRSVIPSWVSGYSCAQNATLLIHDAQYTPEQYERRVGWGHSTIPDAIAYAGVAAARHLTLFHHDPSHNDAELQWLYERFIEHEKPSFGVSVAKEGQTLVIQDHRVLHS
jgi:phosphoribosyl 1,2-cyclic phosphodiesterase